MRTIYLRFTDRGAALTRLMAVLGHGPDAETGVVPTTGERAGTRFDVDEVGEIHTPAPEGAGEDFMPEALPGWHVNLLWWGADETAPDFGADEISPATPSRVFAF